MRVLFKKFAKFIAPNEIKRQRGNVLVTSLLILMVMNLLGIGLANLATKEWTSASYKSIDSSVFQVAETCSQDVITWFETQTGTPTSVSDFTGTESSNASTYSKLSGYTYGCSVAYITTKQDASSNTSGGEIGNSGGSYNTSGNIVPKDYYQITSTGTGPKNSTKVINSIISVEY